MSAATAKNAVLRNIAPTVNKAPADSNAALLAELAALKAENARLLTLKTGGGTPSWKVQDKDKVNPETGEVKEASFAISVYGLGRFPVTMYREQWVRFMTVIKAFEAFLNSPETIAKCARAVKKPKTVAAQ